MDLRHAPFAAMIPLKGNSISFRSGGIEVPHAVRILHILGSDGGTACGDKIAHHTGNNIEAFTRINLSKTVARNHSDEYLTRVGATLGHSVVVRVAVALNRHH